MALVTFNLNAKSSLRLYISNATKGIYGITVCIMYKNTLIIPNITGRSRCIGESVHKSLMRIGSAHGKWVAANWNPYDRNIILERESGLLLQNRKPKTEMGRFGILALRLTCLKENQPWLATCTRHLLHRKNYIFRFLKLKEATTNYSLVIPSIDFTI